MGISLFENPALKEGGSVVVRGQDQQETSRKNCVVESRGALDKK